MTASSRTLLAALVLTAGSLWPAGAYAGPPRDAKSEAEFQTARSLYRDAVALHRDNKLEEALARITAAYRTVQTPVIALEMGKIRIALGQTKDAYDVLHDVEEIPVTARESEKGREARREAASLLASLRERLATLLIVVEAAPTADLTLRIDGAPIPFSRGEIVVDVGAHRVSLERDGRPCAGLELQLAAAEARSLNIHDLVGSCSERDRALATRPDSGESAKPAHRNDGATAARPGARERSSSAVRWVGLGVASAGLISVTAGVFVGLGAKADYDSVASGCVGASCTQIAFDTRESARTRAGYANYAVGLGVGAIAGGALLWFLGVKGNKDDDLRARLGLTPWSVSLSLPLP